MRALLLRLESNGAPLVTDALVAGILKGLDPGNAPDAVRVLQALARSLKNGGIEPFPRAELPAYLTDRGVAEDEMALVRAVKVRAPRALKEVSFVDAYLTFGRETGASVVPDMRFEQDPQAAQAVLVWMAGVKRLKPAARRLWAQAVRKVHLGAPRGTEDASWAHDGRLNLTVDRISEPGVRASQITHELGHAFDEIYHLSGTAPWGAPPYVSDYAEFKPHVEDVPESFAAYVIEPALLKRKCPDKYEIIRKAMA